MPKNQPTLSFPLYFLTTSKITYKLDRLIKIFIAREKLENLITSETENLLVNFASDKIYKSKKVARFEVVLEKGNYAKFYQILARKLSSGKYLKILQRLMKIFSNKLILSVGNLDDILRSGFL